MSISFYIPVRQHCTCAWGQERSHLGKTAPPDCDQCNNHGTFLHSVNVANATAEALLTILGRPSLEDSDGHGHVYLDELPECVRAAWGALNRSTIVVEFVTEDSVDAAQRVLLCGLSEERLRYWLSELLTLMRRAQQMGTELRWA